MDEDDGFPDLPTDVDELQVFRRTDAKKGDFITFTELACDESTDWQPKTVTRTAQIQQPPGEQNDPTVIQLSTRDLKQKAFDEEGNRLYSKFEMPDNDSEDEGTREVLWKELGTMRLVLRPEGEDDDDT